MANHFSHWSTIYAGTLGALIAAYVAGYVVVSEYELVERKDLSKPFWPAPSMVSHERHFASDAWRRVYRPLVRIESLVRGKEISARTADELDWERKHFGMEEFIVP